METVDCQNCDHTYGREETTICPECGYDNKDLFDELYGEED